MCTAAWYCGLVRSFEACSSSDIIFRFKSRCFLLCGQVENSSLLFSEKGGCRQYRPSPMCTSCIYRLQVPFQGSFTLLYGLCCFLLQMCSLSDVVGWLSLKLDVCITRSRIMLYRCLPSRWPETRDNCFAVDTMSCFCNYALFVEGLLCCDWRYFV